jgi:hypothetical protein
MGKLIFAGIVLVAGLALHGVLQRRMNFFPPGLRSVVLRTILVFAIGLPAVILAFSIFRIIPVAMSAPRCSSVRWRPFHFARG